MAFSTATIGRKSSPKARMAGLTRSTTDSGACSASALGIISPKTTCRNVMALRAMAKPTACDAP